MADRAASQDAKSGKKYVLTGVNGLLGGFAATFAMQIAQPTDQLVFTSHDLSKLPAAKLQQWKEHGVQVEEADYDNVEQMTRVFEGAEAVAFISTWTFGKRRNQAKNVCDAAKKAGVKRVCYTSFVGADSTEPEDEMLFLPRDHRANEKMIMESGLQYSIQRDYLYLEIVAHPKQCELWKYCDDRWLNNTHGVPGAYVSREDCGNVLAALLLGKGKPNTIYTITGPEPITDYEVFRFIREQTGCKTQFVDMEDDDLRLWWVNKGMASFKENQPVNTSLPLPIYVEDLVCGGQTVASGQMRHSTNHVELLTGRKPRNFREVFAENAAQASK